MVDENPYRSPSATPQATSFSPLQPRFMSRFERFLVLFHLVCMVVYLPCFLVIPGRLQEGGAAFPLYVTIFFTLHFSLMLLALATLIVIIRDLYLRDYFTANQKLTWGLLFVLLSPSIYLYFFRHAWKPRTMGSG